MDVLQYEKMSAENIKHGANDATKSDATCYKVGLV